MSPFPRIFVCAGLVLLLEGCRSAPTQRVDRPTIAAKDVAIATVPLAASPKSAIPHSGVSPASNASFVQVVSAEQIDTSTAELDVDWLVAEVEARNPSLQALVYAWQSAAQRYPQAVSLDDPMMMAMFAPQSVGSSDVETAYALEASQKIPWFGKRALRGERAEAQADMAAWDADNYRQQLISLTRTAYFDYYLVDRQQALLTQNRTAMEQFRNTAQSRFRANQVTQQDVLQADVELADLERKTIELARVRRVSVGRINTLLRLPPSAPLARPVLALDPTVPAQDVDALQQLALGQRADIGSLRAQIHEAEAEVGLAHKNYFPDVEFFGRYDTFWQPSTTQGDLRGQAGVRMNMPIYRQRLQSAYCEAVLKLNQRRAEYEQKLLDVSYDVQTAHAELEESQLTVALYANKYVPIAEQSLRAAKVNYEAGKGSFLELLTAQRRLIEVRQTEQESLALLHRRDAALRRTVGNAD